MKTLGKLLVSLFLILALQITLYTLHSYAAVPHLINYQGRLTDKQNKPLEGAYTITFKIYDAESGPGTMTPWQEAHQGILIQKGLFNVLLGSASSLNLPFDKPYFLEIKVGSEVMGPRQRITSAGYAIRAEEAEKLGGRQPSDYALATEITSTPTANKAVRLDANAKLPSSALGLKTYDSGWVGVSANSTHTQNHPLGTTKLLILVYSAKDTSGTDMMLETGPAGGAGISIATITKTSITIYVDINGFNYIPNYRIQSTSGYARIIAIALE